jgi:putative N6-adenine-specific DNA methylase
MYNFVCTCAFGLESVLKRELRALGYAPAAVSDGAVEVSGTREDMLVLNMSLRCCNRVLLHMGTCRTETFDDLYDAAFGLPWEEIIAKDGKFDVAKITCVKSRLMSKTDAQRIIKKAVVDRLKSRYKAQTLPENGPAYQIYIKIKNDMCAFYLNTSGESLHKRGYRARQVEAPLKETLAAGIILLSGYDGTQPFADIMCGSGTFVIEAALIASNTPPGLRRSFAFESWGLLEKEACLRIRCEAEAKIIRPDIRLLGSDIDKKAVVTAKQNAERASAGDITAFQTLDFKDFSSKKKNGMLVINPPYGQRIGESGALRGMYAGCAASSKASTAGRCSYFAGTKTSSAFMAKKRIKTENFTTEPF